jgi:site-specific DNA recombinase
VQFAEQAMKVERQIDNLMAFIREGDTSARVRQDLNQLEERLMACRTDQKRLEETPSNAIVIPPAARIKELGRTSFANLAIDSFEYAKLMRVIIPKIAVFPYRLCDGGMIVLRASFRLQMSRLISEKRAQEALQQPLERRLTVDLLDPRQREACRGRIVELRAGGITEKEAAEACGMTITAAQRSAALQRMMDARSLTDPYVAVTEPPDDCKKLRRHRHPRYHFEPLDGVGEI